MKNTCFLALLTSALIACIDARGQLVTYDFEGDTAVASQSDSGVNAGNFMRNPGNTVSYFGGNGGGDAISGAGWTGSDSSNNEYWEFTITANAGVTLELSELAFDYRSTGTGPTNWELAVNGTVAGSGNLVNDSSFHSISAPLSFSGLSSATVRVSGYGASSSSGSLRMDNVTLDGLALTPVPEPSTWLLLSGGLAFLATRFRRRK